MIGRREQRTNNSWMHNVPSLVAGSERCLLLMHPEDAAARGVADGERVVLSSRVHRGEVRLRVSDEMAPGVVSLPHGWGHHLPGARLALAAVRPGANLNVLLSDQARDPLSGNAVLSGQAVTLSAM